MTTPRTLMTFVFCSSLLVGTALAQQTLSSHPDMGSWTRVTAPAPFLVGASHAQLMTDGTVMIQDFCSSDWWSLTPDIHGSYINGTWTQKASLPPTYGPLFYASEVLADGKLIVNGGEYSTGGPNCRPQLTNNGAIYDPVANTWTPVAPPSGWLNIGDAASVVLSDGTYMIANPFSTEVALLNENTMTWTTVSRIYAELNLEDGWTLLPSGDVFTVDVFGEPHAELFHRATRSWSYTTNTPHPLSGGEIGPQVLRFDGTVFVIGFMKYTAIYDSKTATWSDGPDLPYVNGQQLDDSDSPATLLKNGNILSVLGIGVYTPAYFFLSDGKTFTQIPGPPNSVNDEQEQFNTLMLPTGQVLVTDWSNDVEIYTPSSGEIQGIKPVITSVPTTLVPGETYTITGKRFNGFSQTNFYGDDSQSATNYPLVRITNNATKHVFYARTHNHSYMGVASQAPVSTEFDVPTSIETGPSTAVAVANGFSSQPVAVNIQ